MPLRALISVSLLLCLVAVSAAAPPIKVGFYNTRNLYDTVNDPSTSDAEFLPDAPLKWNSDRYNSKIEALANAVKLFNPTVLGLCEVENRAAVADLAAKIGRLDVVHYDSKDRRGIDVAMLVDTSRMDIISSEPVNVGRSIRDFLMVELRERVSATRFTIYVVHLPSKRGGQHAKGLRDVAMNFIDSIAYADRAKNIIFCGDFNDAPKELPHLYNTAVEAAKRGAGSYAYRDSWTMLDQILVTSPVRAYLIGSQNVVVDASLITPYGRYRGYPNRDKVSDHLPVYIELKIN